MVYNGGSIKAWLLGLVVGSVIIFGLVGLYDARAAGKLGGEVGRGTGLGLGATANGVAAVPGGFRSTFQGGGTWSGGGNVPAASAPASQEPVAAATAEQNARLKKKLAAQDKAIKKLQQQQSTR